MSERKPFFVFPGQGSQYVGMGTDLVEQFQAARDVFARASEAAGYDMQELCFRDPRDELGLTRFTQPALLTHQIACLESFRTLTRGPVTPVIAGGHSLGEYAALVAAGALGFEDALALVQERGRLMSTLGRGSMLATTLDLESARVLADRHYCGIGGCNLAEQTVIAGDDADLDALAIELGSSRRAIRLNTEGAFHTYLMVSAAQEFRPVLERTALHVPQFPVLSNYTGTLHEPDPDAIRPRLFFQLFSPVRWTDCMSIAMDSGIDTIIEFGGGIGKGATPADKRPNLESIVRKSLKSRGQEAQYLPAINADGIRAAAEQLSGG